MSKTKTKTNNARRDFIRSSALAGAGATVTAVLPGVTLAAEAEVVEAKPVEKYRVTPHISDYYKTLS